MALMIHFYSLILEKYHSFLVCLSRLSTELNGMLCTCTGLKPYSHEGGWILAASSWHYLPSCPTLLDYYYTLLLKEHFK